MEPLPQTVHETGKVPQSVSTTCTQLRFGSASFARIQVKWSVVALSVGFSQSKPIQIYGHTECAY